MGKTGDKSGMNIENSTYVEGKFRRFVPRKQLNEGWHYYEFDGSNDVVGVRVVVNETYIVTEEGGEPLINNDTKTNIFEWDQQVETRILTRQQYDKIISSGFEE